MTRILVCCLLAVLAAGNAVAASSPSELSGTWSGSFDIRFEDGRVINDTAWLVLQQTGTTVAGTVGPRSDQQGPVREGSVSGNELRFVADSTPGKVLRFALAHDGETLSGEARGEIGNDRVRVVLKVKRNAAASATVPNPLFEKLLALDTALFDSFNKCSEPAELRKHAALFAKDVEFYHDLGGLTLGVDALMTATRNNVCGKFRRELDLASFRVYPIPGYGAMSMGTHRFCHTPDTCEGVAEFTTVWKENGGDWQVTRALSYAHGSLN